MAGEINVVTASTLRHLDIALMMLRKLAGYPRQNSVARALREVGRVERTVFMLDWLDDAAPLGWEHISLTGDYL